MRLTLPALVVAAAVATGCAGTGTYSSGYAYGYDSGYGYDGYYDPELVYLSPGVSVVAGYDYPVFYANDYYWRYHNDRWFRSPYYNRGWVYATPPRVISRIDRPYRYRNYRPQGYTVRRTDRYRNIRDHRDDRGYRDYRGYDRRRVIRDRDDRRPVYRGSDRRYRRAPDRSTPRRSPVIRNRGDGDRGFDRRNRPSPRDRR